MSAPLTFGLGRVVPDGVAAWGARFIVTQDGHVDLPWDRHDLFVPDGEDRQAFLDWLQATLPMSTLRQVISSKLKSREIGTREAQVHTLFNDNNLMVQADTNASAGYLYLAAWRVPDEELA